MAWKLGITAALSAGMWTGDGYEVVNQPVQNIKRDPKWLLAHVLCCWEGAMNDESIQADFIQACHLHHGLFGDAFAESSHGQYSLGSIATHPSPNQQQYSVMLGRGKSVNSMS